MKYINEDLHIQDFVKLYLAVRLKANNSSVFRESQ